MPGSLTLAIEISNPSAVERGAAVGPGSTSNRGVAAGGTGPGVALGRGAGPSAAGPTLEVLAVESVAAGSRHDDGLMVSIDRVFRAAGAVPRDLSFVAVSVGPGGYTALRIATATSKMLAEAAGARCVGVPSAEVVARRVKPGGRGFAVLLATSGETFFMTLFDAAGSPTGPGRSSDASHIRAARPGLIVADRFAPESARVAAREIGSEVVAPHFDPVALLEVSAGRTGGPPESLSPIYAREPVASTLWKSRPRRDM